MKKIGDKIYLTEEEASPSYLYPDCIEVTGIPLCNVCRNWEKAPIFTAGERRGTVLRLFWIRRILGFLNFLNYTPKIQRNCWSGKSRSEYLLTKAS